MEGDFVALHFDVEVKYLVQKNATKRRRRSPDERKGASLKFIPLGGVSGIGKNISVLEYGDDILVIDCGLMFPDEEMLGVDFVIPDPAYLLANKERIRGMVITHGHDDHIGALPYILPELDCPIYATRLTLGLIKSKMEERAPKYELKAKEIQAGDVIDLGCFKVQPFSVCHSIPDGVGYAIHTPLGVVLHTGDFKLDPTPIDGRATDYALLASLGTKGVLLMLSDSTNVERDGFTPSERMVGKTMEQTFRLYKNKRIIISSFASNLHRVQQVIETAVRFNRKVALIGRSMIANVARARELGYMDVDDDVFIQPSEIEGFPSNRLVVITTGSQGEPFSGLVLMSRGDHRFIKLGPKDLVVISALPIPGNERLVHRTINDLFKQGCEVIYEAEQNIHVSGHASREELKMMLSLIKPSYFVPLHGEYRHLVKHKQLAEEMGVPAKNAFVMEEGDVLSITKRQARISGKVPAGAYIVDGRTYGDMKGGLLGERKDLAEEGVFCISVVLDSSGNVIAPLSIESKGFLHRVDADELYRQIEDAVEKAVKAFAREKRERKDEDLASRIRSAIKGVLRRYSLSSPVILVLVNEVKENAILSGFAGREYAK